METRDVDERPPVDTPEVDDKPPVDTPEVDDKPPVEHQAPAPMSGLVPVALLAAAIVGAYFSSFLALWNQWSSDPNYSHGYFVIPIALVIAWSRREMIDPAKLRPRWWGFLPFLAVMGLRYQLFEWNEQYLETGTIPLIVASAAFAIGGWHLLRVILPAALFLYLMLPLPPSLNGTLAGPLQTVATAGSVTILELFGMPVLAEGNVIIVGSEKLEVARACNGLSMLLSFVTLITAMVILVRRPLVERIVLLLSTVPIAIISNILRIAATAWAYERFGHEAGEKIAHDWAGWLMMPTALVLVLLEMKIMSWLIVDVEEPAHPLGPRQF